MTHMTVLSRAKCCGQNLKRRLPKYCEFPNELKIILNPKNELDIQHSGAQYDCHRKKEDEQQLNEIT